MKHLKQHILVHREEARCPFQDCHKIFPKVSSFTAHISKDHRHSKLSFVQSVNNNAACHPTGNILTDTSNDNAGTQHRTDPCQTVDDVIADDHCTDDKMGSDNANVDELLLKDTALFFLKLQVKYLIPASTVQKITEELTQLHYTD